MSHGYEGFYQVSNLGRVLSFPRKGTRTKEKRILKPTKTRKGYLQVTLMQYKTRYRTGIHRLVALAFIPNINNKPQVNHIDGNKENNCVNNLEWVTNQENTIHAWNNGLISKERTYHRGKEHYGAVQVNQYSLDGKFIKKWDCIRYIEDELGFDNRNISACCRHKKKMAYGYIWRYIGDETEIYYNPIGKNMHNGKYIEWLNKQ